MRKVAETSANVEARSSPHGFWRFSADYLIAAEIVEGKVRDQRHVYFPMLQLYATSIELSLKAFLLQRGASLDDMRSSSHNLVRILAEARRRKLGREVKLDAREVTAIHILNINYSSHQLRYIVAGSTKVPQPIYVARAARKLVIGLELLCTGVSGRFKHAA